MATHPKKAEAWIDLARGDSLDSVAARYNIPKATVQSWKKKVDLAIGVPAAREERNAQFVESLLDAAVTAVRANQAQHSLLGDKDFLRNMLLKPDGAKDLVILLDAVLKNTIIVGRITGAFEGRSADGAEIVRAEIVDG